MQSDRKPNILCLDFEGVTINDHLSANPRPHLDIFLEFCPCQDRKPGRYKGQIKVKKDEFKKADNDIWDDFFNSPPLEDFEVPGRECNRETKNATDEANGGKGKKSSAIED